MVKIFFDIFLIKLFLFSQFLVSFCLLIFSILYACREQLLIFWPYWLVFLPLFIWKTLAILGAIIGIFTYCCIRPRK
jgi:hypothetical protein